jgi:hypothetical protein
VIGETGIQAGSTSCRTSVTNRAAAIQRKLTGYLGYAGVSGVQVWSAVRYNPVTAAEPCPLELPVTDPILSTMKTVQAGRPQQMTDLSTV